MLILKKHEEKKRDYNIGNIITQQYQSRKELAYNCKYHTLSDASQVFHLRKFLSSYLKLLTAHFVFT